LDIARTGADMPLAQGKERNMGIKKVSEPDTV
jgi:hypothetical protein